MSWMDAAQEQKWRKNLQDNKTAHGAGNNQSIRHYKKAQFPKQALVSQSIKQAEKGNGQSTRGSSSTQQHQQGDSPGVGPIQTHCSKDTHTPAACAYWSTPNPPRLKILTPVCFFFTREEEESHAPGWLLLAGRGWLIHKAIFRNRRAGMKLRELHRRMDAQILQQGR